MVSMHGPVDGSSLWRQRLQHIDITRLSYNAVRRHGTRLPRYKEGRLYLEMVGRIQFTSFSPTFVISEEKNVPRNYPCCGFGLGRMFVPPYLICLLHPLFRCYHGHGLQTPNYVAVIIFVNLEIF